MLKFPHGSKAFVEGLLQFVDGIHPLKKNLPNHLTWQPFLYVVSPRVATATALGFLTYCLPLTKRAPLAESSPARVPRTMYAESMVGKPLTEERSSLTY